MPRALHPLDDEPGALDACAVVELLEVLWRPVNDAATVGAVPPSQLRALTVIEQHIGINLRDLGEALGSAPPAISRLCDRLEAAGLIQRTRAATNRRVIELSVSRHGRAVLEETRVLRARQTAEILQRMSPRHRQALAQGLAAFRAAAAPERTAPPSDADGLSDTA
ncbi:MarR family winged helix-turn-helix transcriptional regulator [Streptomyces sp. NPDC054797]